ncbi:hypothetical protein OC846_002138 [Tilletia horrida]|uniref:Uncharacterized protein n=1 Tax=Tilletia horrida TaxID=155126 RepID=A0AAN6JSY4_9BASI|nr:hypothetical protein OC846_002138 [Tilletia horrida]
MVFREGAVGSMPTSPSGGHGVAEHGGYFQSGGSPSSIMSRSPPQTMQSGTTAALSSFTPSGGSHPPFSGGHARSATIPSISSSSLPSGGRSGPYPPPFYGPSGPPLESPSGASSHPRFQQPPPLAAASAWHDRQGGRMGPPTSQPGAPHHSSVQHSSAAAYTSSSGMPPSASWPSGVGQSSAGVVARPQPSPVTTLTMSPSTPFEAEILSRMGRVENAIESLRHEMHSLVHTLAISRPQLHPDAQNSISPPATSMHSGERPLIAAERHPLATSSPHPHGVVNPSPRPRNETISEESRTAVRSLPPGPTHLPGSAGPHGFRRPSPPMLGSMRGSRPQTSGSNSDERVQIPPRTSSSAITGRGGSPSFASTSPYAERLHGDDYPRSTAGSNLEVVPERPSSWAGQRPDLERRGDSNHHHPKEESLERSALIKPRTPPELPSVSAIDAWRSSAALRGRQRATTDLGIHVSPGAGFSQAQLPPLRMSQSQHQQQQQQARHQHHSDSQQQAGAQRYHSDDHPSHNQRRQASEEMEEDGRPGVKRQRLSSGSN